MSQELTQSSFNLSKHPETKGFDLQSGETWIYPTNYPVRDYQYNIVQKALLNNTLVSLPTGLGKTFIAAVVMYNFFRWYPMGKIIFMAPTRPLVKQQIDACYDIMAIPKDVTAELTGTKLANYRGDIWKQKRVFFITPQILQNDLDKLTELGPIIKCLVFDEAHRARGNHAYCEVIRKLIPHNKFFRILALSATPGSTVNDVLEVVQNLLISHLEFRTEESLDVRPYVYERNLTTVVVPLGEKLQQVREDYLGILEYYTRILVKHKVIQGNCGNLTKGKIFMTMKEFQAHNTGSSNYAEIMKNLNVCVTLYHAFELLIRHGLRSFLAFFDEHIDKPLLRGNFRLIEIVDDVREYLGPEPIIEQLPDGSYPEVPKSIKFGHPKFYKLRDILISHFTQASDSSRVIVFFEYRHSVKEAYALLIQARPILKPRIFLGQGHGITQRVQINVVKSFREGQCNVLLSTSIGEEGLDVGDVDLIVCFDISNKSPIRMVQRMGRTGRKKKGNIIVLVTEGKEQQILKDCLIHKNNIAFHVLSSNELTKRLCSSSPRLVPLEISPKCNKIYITVKKPVLSKNSSLKDMFRSISASASEPSFSPELQIVDIQERISESPTLWNKGLTYLKNPKACITYSKRIEKQRSLHPIYTIKHSLKSEILVNILQLADSKRFNIPVSQIGSGYQLSQSRNLKQSDIRNMFLKSQSDNNCVLQTQVPNIPASDVASLEDKYPFNSKELFAELSSYLSIQSSNVHHTQCRHCPNNFNCDTNNTSLQKIDLNWIQLEDSVFNKITIEDLNLFSASLSVKDQETLSEFNKCDSSLIISNISDIEEKTPVDIITDNPFNEISFTYQPPKNLELLLNRYSSSFIDVEISDQKNEKNPNRKSTKLYNLVQNWTNSDILNFFKLTCLAELFNHTTRIDQSQETIIYSPDIIDNTFIRDKELEKSDDKNKKSDEELSPVLCKFDRLRTGKHFQKNIVKDLLVDDKQFELKTSIIQTPHSRPNLQKLKMGNQVKLNNTPRTDIIKVTSTPIGNVENNPKFQMSDDNEVDQNKRLFDSSPSKRKTLDVDDICDLSIFGLPTPSSNTNQSIARTENHRNIEISVISNNSFPEAKSEKNHLDIEDLCELSTFGIVCDENINPSQNYTYINPHTDTHKINESKVIKKLSEKQHGNHTQKKENHQQRLTVDLTNLSSPKKISDLNKSCSSTQATITQILELVNKEDGNKNISKTLDFPEDLKDFDLDTSALDKFRINIQDISCENYSPLFRKKKKKLNITQNITPSSTSKLSLSNKNYSGKLKNVSIIKSVKTSDDEFEEQSTSSTYLNTTPNKSQVAKRKISVQNSKASKKKKNINPFIANEAELSDDDNLTISDDEDEEDQSIYDKSFVTDETINMDTQMHARYLQSVKSPKKTGPFKIPQRPPKYIPNIYSQEVVNMNETYLDDSFVVHDETELTQHELSELEVLEQKLEKINKKKRNKADHYTEPVKRRRILEVSSDSD